MPEERKLATILFADIVGSTTLAGQHDPERVRTVFRRTFEHLREVIESHGGTVEKFIGDEVMAVFGVPVAHDDDAQRAVRCALAIRAATAAFEPAARLEVTLRTGVNTGDVIASLDSGDQNLVTGQAVNAAARLRAAASPSEILVGALTKKLTDRGIRYGEQRAVEAKNIGTLDAWPAEALLTATPEQDRGLPGLRAPLIGRDDELRLLTEAYRRIAGEARPYLVTIFGPPGAGKSRLTEEFLATLDGASIRRGRCLPYGEVITFFALQGMFREELDIDADATREAALEALDRVTREVFDGDPDAEAVRRRVSVVAGLADAKEALPEIGEGEISEELRWGVRRYWERRAAAGPLVLVFEDIHWAEPRLLEIIEDLAEWSRAPMLILCLARPDLRETRPNWGGGATNAAAIALSPLTGDESRTLIAELLAVDELSEQLRGEVVRRAEGNPLYVEEFLRMLMDSGRIAQQAGRWVGVAGLEAVEVPPTLQGIITARLDRVAPEVKALLQCASLAGYICSTSALAALLGEPPKAEHLREAVRRELLIEADERSAIGTGRVYRFKHVLIRDVAYSTLPKAERSALHDRYGRWLELSLGERSSDLGDIVAFHAEQAALLAREIDSSTAPSLARLAFDRLVGAADRAFLREDYEAATDLYRRCARVAETTDTSLQERFHVRAFSALAGTWTPGTELIDEGRRIGPSRALAYLLMYRGIRLPTDGTEAAMRTLLEEALSIARATGDPETISRVWRVAHIPMQWTGDLDAADASLQEAIGYDRANGLTRGRAASLSGLAGLALDRGRFSAAAAYLEEAAPLVESTRSRIARWLYLLSQAALAKAVGDHPQAVASATEIVELGHGGQATAQNQWILGYFLLGAAAYEPARSALEQGIAAFESSNRGQRPHALANLAQSYLALGNIAAASTSLREAEATVFPWDVQALMAVRLTAAMVAARRGDAPDAEARFREAIDGIAGTQFVVALADARLAFARFLIEQQRPAEVREQLTTARGAFSDPLAFRRRDEIDALLRLCDAVRA